MEKGGKQFSLKKRKGGKKMKKFLLLAIAAIILGVGCSSTKTLTYHQWVPSQITQQQSSIQQQQQQHLKK